MKNVSTANHTTFEVTQCEGWNVATNTLYKGYSVTRWRGGAGWEVAKFATWEAANKCAVMLTENREQEVRMGWDFI